VSAPLRVADITSYLDDSGWLRRSSTWRGAAIWARDDVELLVPPRDGMGDGEARVRELLACLAEVEHREPDEVATDIASPQVDSAAYRPDPDGGHRRGIALVAGVQAVQAAHGLLGAAARTVVEGPSSSFRGRTPREVAQVLADVRLDVPRRSAFELVVRVPFTAGRRVPHAQPLGRGVLTQVQDAAAAVQEAARSGDPAAFDDVVLAGASSEFCVALSNLAGLDREEPFRLGFRWGRGAPSPVSARTIAFPPGSGALIRRGARRMSGLGPSGAATVTGVVESLHDRPGAGDRWRVRVRGELRTGRGVAHRAVWVRLDGPRAYDRALLAHRGRVPVHVEGVVAGGSGIAVRPGGFDVVDPSAL
jgi:hypothetical protein